MNSVTFVSFVIMHNEGSHSQRICLSDRYVDFVSFGCCLTSVITPSHTLQVTHPELCVLVCVKFSDSYHGLSTTEYIKTQNDARPCGPKRPDPGDLRIICDTLHCDWLPC